MCLKTIELDVEPAPLPPAVRNLLDDADRRIEAFQHTHRERPLAAFVPCDFVMAYHALTQVGTLSLATGRRFAEWGSGAGVVACLAASLGWDAVGIEIEGELVDLAEDLAEDHGFEVEFVRASFLPPGLPLDSYEQRDVNWLATDGPDAYDEIGLDPDDFDLVFAYPWPGEEHAVLDAFSQSAGDGALLLTYHGQEGVALRRKMR
ncbi:MAG: class I SAM-dependent methyltransferase [Planctomycetota bacterium]